MEPTISVVTKTDAFQFLWLKNVRGFDRQYHCYDCLKGNRSKIIPLNGGRKYPAGFSAEGRIEEPVPYSYLCAVTPAAKGIDANVHILMHSDENSTFTYEDDNIRVFVTGMRRLTIEPLPAEVQDTMPELYWRCRNFQAGWQLFPEDRLPIDGSAEPVGGR